MNLVTLLTEIAPHLTMPFLRMMGRGAAMVSEITADAVVMQVWRMAGVFPFLITLEARHAWPSPGDNPRVRLMNTEARVSGAGRARLGLIPSA